MADMPDYVQAVYTSVKNTWQDAENLDDEHGYETFIWIPEETYKVDKMKLHIYSEKFRAYSKATSTKAFNVITSGDGGADILTSTYTTPSHAHNISGRTTGVNESGVQGYYITGLDVKYAHATSYDRTHQNDETTILSIPMFQNCPNGHANCQAYDVTEITYPTHNHQHDIPDVEAFQAIVSFEQMNFAHKAHSHSITATSTQSGGGNHRHTVTLSDHAHSVTIPNHTHGITFGIYEEAITERTLSAILYDPDGNKLEDFGVVLTGEDNDIIDLTDHFGTLQYGMYKIVLSASGRLRARLVFYELCKMYAQY